jgi:hypothetical protein
MLWEQVRPALTHRAGSKRVIAATDAEIDEVVYELYGIMDEEQQRIESSGALRARRFERRS